MLSSAGNPLVIRLNSTGGAELLGNLSAVVFVYATFNMHLLGVDAGSCSPSKDLQEGAWMEAPRRYQALRGLFLHHFQRSPAMTVTAIALVQPARGAVRHHPPEPYCATGQPAPAGQSVLAGGPRRFYGQASTVMAAALPSASNPISHRAASACNACLVAQPPPRAIK